MIERPYLPPRKCPENFDRNQMKDTIIWVGTILGAFIVGMVIVAIAVMNHGGF